MLQLQQRVTSSHQNIVREYRIVIDENEVEIAVLEISLDDTANRRLINCLRESVAVNRCLLVAVKLWIVENIL